MMRQEDIFRATEGTAWLQRNAEKIGKRDPVTDAIRELKLKPKHVFEFGCSNGWRLKKLADEFGCHAWGVDPSLEAIKEAPKRGSVNGEPTIWPSVGTASRTDAPDYLFDVVIYGFCLYVADRDDLLRIAAEGDRLLTDGGHLIIHDFHTEKPHAVPYHHDIRLRTYKMDYANLWLSNPAYSLAYRRVYGLGNNRTAVSAIKKNIASAYPLIPGGPIDA